MVDDLTALYPLKILNTLFWLGRQKDWFKVVAGNPKDVREALLPTTVYDFNRETLENAPDCPEKKLLLGLIKAGDMHRTGMLALGYLEAGSCLVKSGPKLFQPTHEQFESMGYVDLHIPIADFRSPYPVFVVRIPNEWRRNRSRELGLDVQRQPKHVLVRTSTTVDGKVHILCILKYPEVEHYNVVTDQPFHKDLQSAFNFVVDFAFEHVTDESTKHLSDEEREYLRVKRLEFRYCTDAIHCALNCCLMMVNFGYREGDYLDPRIHQRNNKTQDPRRFADFKSVDMVQNIVIRQTELAPLPPSQPGSVGDSTIERDGPLWEVKPHWRRGHWRRKPGWQAYVEAGQQPPRSFVRPTLVRRDRIVGDVAESSTIYRSR